jgi:serine/threonine protein kinase
MQSALCKERAADCYPSAQVKIMRTLRHPNIVEFLGVCVQPEAGTPIIVTEYLANGSLEDVLEKKVCRQTFCSASQSNVFCVQAKDDKKLSMKRTIALAKDIACGLNWLHHKGSVLTHSCCMPDNFSFGTAS